MEPEPLLLVLWALLVALAPDAMMVAINRMKTYEIKDDKGKLLAFEINNYFLSFKTLVRILNKFHDVNEVRLGSEKDIRLHFKYKGCPFVAWEPFGDNSRIWIGPEGGFSEDADVASLKTQFDSR
jgi:hypothetical protein